MKRNQTKIHSWLSRCCAARGSRIGIFQYSPARVKARKYFLFAESSLMFENKDHLVDFYCHTLFLHHFASMLYVVTKSNGIENEKIIT